MTRQVKCCYACPRGVRKTHQSASVQRVDLAPACAPASPLQIDQIVRERRRPRGTSADSVAACGVRATGIGGRRRGAERA